MSNNILYISPEEHKSTLVVFSIKYRCLRGNRQVPKKRIIWAKVFCKDDTKIVQSIHLYSVVFSRHEGISKVQTFLTEQGYQIDGATMFTLVNGVDGEHIISLRDYFSNVEIYRDKRVYLETNVPRGTAKKKTKVENNENSIDINNLFKSRLKFKVLDIEEGSPRVRYMVFDKLKRQNKKKSKIRIWATVLIDTEKENVEEIHYHRFIKTEPNGIDLVRECLRNNEWEIAPTTNESVKIRDKKEKSYIPLTEYLSNTEYYNKVLN